MSHCRRCIRRGSSFVLKDERSKIKDIVVVRISCSHHVDIVISSQGSARFELNFHIDSPKIVDLYRKRFILCIHPCTENWNEAVSSFVLVIKFAIKLAACYSKPDHPDFARSLRELPKNIIVKREVGKSRNEQR